MEIRFLPDDVTVEAQAGEALLDVAERAGVYIPTGCLMGSCHACEVEIDGGNVICACIAAVPRGREEMIVNINFDPSW